MHKYHLVLCVGTHMHGADINYRKKKVIQTCVNLC